MRQDILSRRKFLLTSFMLGLGINKFPEIDHSFRANRPLRAAATTAGMAGTWNQQGQQAANLYGRWLGVDFTWFDGGWDVPTQLNAINNIAQGDWDFIIVQPSSIGALMEPIQNICKAGTPVIDMDTLIAPFPQLKEMGVVTFIAPDNVTLAEGIVQKLVMQMGGSGKIAQTWGQQGHTGSQGRAQGFYNIVSQYPGIEVVDDQPGDWLVDKATEIWEILLKRHPDLKAGFLHNDDMALAARAVVEKSGLQNQVVLGGFDGMSPAIQAVRDGKLLVTARNSASRIHGWAVLAGVFAATVGLETASQLIPPFILADGGLISAAIDNDPALIDEPWKLRNYGLSSIDGQIWAEDQLLF